MEYSRANRIYEAVVGNAADLGIVAYPARRSGLQILPFKTDELVVVCHPSHAISKLKKVDIRKLQGQKFIAFERDIPTRRAVDRILRSHRVKVAIAMEFDNVETIKRAVEIDAGISILPHMTVDRELSLGTLSAVRFSKQSHFRPLGILVKQGREIPTVMQRFLDVLMEEA